MGFEYKTFENVSVVRQLKTSDFEVFNSFSEPSDEKILQLEVSGSKDIIWKVLMVKSLGNI